MRVKLHLLSVAISFLSQQLQLDMPVAYSQVLAAGQSLLEAAGGLAEDPLSPDGKELLLSASKLVLEGTMKVKRERE